MLLIIYNVLKRYPGQVLENNLLKSLPNGECRALVTPRTGVFIALKAGDRRHIALGNTQNFPNSVIFRRFNKAVTAAETA